MRLTWLLGILCFVLLICAALFTRELKRGREAHAELTAKLAEIQDSYYELSEVNEECVASLLVQNVLWAKYSLHAAITEHKCRCFDLEIMDADVFYCLALEEKVRRAFEDQWEEGFEERQRQYALTGIWE
jgi:hypothetical protein